MQTREEWKREEKEDEMEEYYRKMKADNQHSREIEDVDLQRVEELPARQRKLPKGSTAWYDERVPPFALWVAGSDDLVDGRRLLKRFANGREPHVRVVHAKVIEEYEHLDVIWAMDVIEQVGREMRDVLWKTCPVREDCKVPKGCEDIPSWVFEGKESSTETGQSSSSAGETPASPRLKRRNFFRRLFSH